MPYVKRDNQGHIVSLTQVEDQGHKEYLKPTAKEIVEFLSGLHEIDQSKSALAESDKELARVTEDLIQLLINKNIILFTELPEPVQQKLLSRKKLRSSMQGVMHNFLHDDEGI